MSRIDWKQAAASKQIGGLAGWLVSFVAQRRRPAHRLELLERITLAPRQSLALVEAEGRRLLVATSAEGPPAFYNLGGLRDRGADSRSGVEPRIPGRVSW